MRHDYDFLKSFPFGSSGPVSPKTRLGDVATHHVYLVSTDLAMCAGVMDSLAALGWPTDAVGTFADGDRFVDAALRQNIHPSRFLLQEIRANNAYASLQPLRNQLAARSDSVIHAFVMCLGQYYRSMHP